MAELVDALDSKSGFRKEVQVRFLFWAPDTADLYRSAVSLLQQYFNILNPFYPVICVPTYHISIPTAQVVSRLESVDIPNFVEIAELSLQT